MGRGLAANATRGAGTGLAARWEAPVGRSLLELAILITAREHPGSATGMRSSFRLAARSAESTTSARRPTYRRAVELFGEVNSVDVVDLMARYAGTAARLAAFNLHMPPGWPQCLPLPFTQPDDVDPQSRSRVPLLPAPVQTLRSTPSLYGRTLAVIDVIRDGGPVAGLGRKEVALIKLGRQLSGPTR